MKKIRAVVRGYLGRKSSFATRGNGGAYAIPRDYKFRGGGPLLGYVGEQKPVTEEVMKEVFNKRVLPNTNLASSTRVLKKKRGI